MCSYYVVTRMADEFDGQVELPCFHRGIGEIILTVGD